MKTAYPSASLAEYGYTTFNNNNNYRGVHGVSW